MHKNFTYHQIKFLLLERHNGTHKTKRDKEKDPKERRVYCLYHPRETKIETLERGEGVSHKMHKDFTHQIKIFTFRET